MCVLIPFSITVWRVTCDVWRVACGVWCVILHRYVSQNSAAKELKVDRVSVRKCLDGAVDDVCGYEFRRAGGEEVKKEGTKEVLFQTQMKKGVMKGVKTEAKKKGGKGKVAKDMEDTEEGGGEGEGEDEEEDNEADEEEGVQKGKEKPGQALPRRTHGMFAKKSTSNGKNHVGAAAAVEAAAVTNRTSGVKSGGKGGKAPAKRTWAAAGLVGGGLIMSRRKRGR